MILSLVLGEARYVPDSLVGLPHDSADLRWLAFLQCYARGVMNWELICYFADHTDDWCSIETIAVELGCSVTPLAGKLGEMSGSRLLEERVTFTGPAYRLTQGQPELRRHILHIGREWSGPGCDAA